MGATFQSGPKFGAAIVLGDAQFARAVFGFADFRGATFYGFAWFENVSWTTASFESATLEGVAMFGDAEFPGNALFVKATFRGDHTPADKIAKQVQNHT